jgi:hypothetical protein
MKSHSPPPRRDAGHRQGLKRRILAHHHRTPAHLFHPSNYRTGYFSKRHGLIPYHKPIKRKRSQTLPDCPSRPVTDPRSALKSSWPDRSCLEPGVVERLENDANEIAGLFERALRNPSNHNPGATITKRVSRESDKRLERLERSAARNVLNDLLLTIACCLPRNASRPLRSAPADLFRPTLKREGRKIRLSSRKNLRAQSAPGEQQPIQAATISTRAE